MEILKVRNKVFKLFLAGIKKNRVHSESLVPQVSLSGHGGMSGGQRAEAEGRESVRQFGARPGQSDHHAHAEQEEGAEGRTTQDKGAGCFSFSGTLPSSRFSLRFIPISSSVLCSSNFPRFAFPSCASCVCWCLSFSHYPVLSLHFPFCLLSCSSFNSSCFFPVLLLFTCFQYPFPSFLLSSACLFEMLFFPLFPSFSPVFFLLPSHPFCLLFFSSSFSSLHFSHPFVQLHFSSFLLCLQFAFSLPFCLDSFLMIFLSSSCPSPFFLQSSSSFYKTFSYFCLLSLSFCFLLPVLCFPTASFPFLFLLSVFLFALLRSSVPSVLIVLPDFYLLFLFCSPVSVLFHFACCFFLFHFPLFL